MAGDGETIGASEYGSVDQEAEENRKESILASTPSLQPNFKRSSVTHQQILKLQELHKRRMQIKAKSKIHKKAKADGKRPGFKNLERRTPQDSDISIRPKHSSSNNFEKSGGSSSGLDDKAVYRLPPRKLHWGLEPKERWERKANM